MQKPQDRFLYVIFLVSAGILAAMIGSALWNSQNGPKLTLNNRDTNAQNEAIVSSGSSEPIQNTPTGVFNYGGSTTWIPIHAGVSAMITNDFPDFELRYTLPANGLPSSSTGLKMLLGGELSFAESSRPLKLEEYDEAKQRGFDLEQVTIAIDGIAVAVNPGIKLPGLSVQQLQAIYAGQVNNWSELGGPDIPIKAYSKDPETSGTAEYFLKSLLDADAYGNNVEFVQETTSTLKKVIRDPGGIFYASAPEVVDQCSIYAMPIAPLSQPNNFIPAYQSSWRTGDDCLAESNTVNKAVFRDGSYPLTRQLFVVVKVDSDRDEAAGRAYSDILLSPDGQEIVQQAGFVSVR